MELTIFSPTVIFTLAIIATLMALSFMVSGSETALMEVAKDISSASNDEEIEVKPSIAKLIANTDKLAYSTLILSNLLNIIIIVLAYKVIDILMPNLNNILDFLIIGITLIVVCYFIPKSLAAHNSMKFARICAPTILILSRLISPFTWILYNIGGRISPSTSSQHENVSVEQLQSAIEATAEDENDDNKKILSSIVSFIGREVSEIMKPRVDTSAIEINSSYPEVLKFINESSYSRLLVYNDSLDNVEGILFIKDLLPHLDDGDNFQWQKLLRPAYFIPENKAINDLLEDFQAKKMHIAIVVDEYGGTLGMVTLEDILEEVVGDITDETDKSSDFYKQLSANTYLFDGATHLVDFAEVMEIDEEVIDDAKGPVDTLAGLMMEIKGGFFSVGDEVSFLNFTLRAEEIERYRIMKIMVVRND